MKACPSCGRLYPADSGFCPVDGSQLGPATQIPVAADASHPRIGQLICDRYQVRRVVADGGMGRVYEALDLQLRQNVAVKILHSEVSEDPVAVERFKREFEVSQQLPHEYIVEVIDFQPTGDGTHAMVMEFLYGEELRSTLKREGVIAPARLVRLLSQVALGLDQAHAKRFVHRDLKPDNLFLCQSGDGDTVKILDFGSVKDKAETAKKLTVLGTTIGSPFYMAPEQAQGLDTLDHRADVWAMSAILYECLTGGVPFLGSSGPAILLQILTKEPPPPSEASRGRRYPVPRSVDAVLTQGLRKSAALRTPTLGALAEGLGHAYGLAGTHSEWAKTREIEIASAIDARMPDLLLVERLTPRSGDPDSFFGEGVALGDSRDSASSAKIAPVLAAPPSAPKVEALSTAELSAIGLTKKGGSSSIGTVLAVGGVALLIGALIAALLFQ